jgi:hypothetical protein
VGVGVGGHASLDNNDPPPQPSPTRGEGVPVAQHRASTLRLCVFDDLINYFLRLMACWAPTSGGSSLSPGL